jgi:hypothetical protein
MKCRRPIYYTEADKALMWERWRQGESSIGADFVDHWTKIR